MRRGQSQNCPSDTNPGGDALLGAVRRSLTLVCSILLCGNQRDAASVLILDTALGMVQLCACA